MTIINNLETAQQKIEADRVGGHPLRLADRVRKAAVDAITDGRDSVKWQRYMALFCDNANELAQLTIERDTDENYMPQVRAYTPANAVCLPVTSTQLTNGLTDKDIEPPDGGDVTGIPEPRLVRDHELAGQLRPLPPVPSE